MITTDNTTFWHIPKTAGRSVEEWFETNKIRSNIMKNGNRVHDRPKRNPSKNEVWWTIVRNPYDRMQSMYRFKCSKEDGAIFKRLHPSFKDWCFSLEQTMRPPYLNEPQWTWASKCKIVLRFENLEEEFKQIQKLYKCYEPLPKVNESKPNIVDTTYTTEMKKAVYKKFEQDFIELGYEK